MNASSATSRSAGESTSRKPGDATGRDQPRFFVARFFGFGLGLMLASGIGGFLMRFIRTASNSRLLTPVGSFMLAYIVLPLSGILNNFSMMYRDASWTSGKGRPSSCKRAVSPSTSNLPGICRGCTFPG